jgi:hypothetical protein
MSVLKILNDLAATQSRLEKEAILKREITNQSLIDTLEAALNPFVNYWIIKIPEYTSANSDIGLQYAISKLRDLSDRKLTGNAGIAHLATLLSQCNPDDAVVLERIIGRDLRCGVSEATVNKIWPGLIPTYDVMLSHKDISGIKYPAIAPMVVACISISTGHGQKPSPETARRLSFTVLSMTPHTKL